MKTKSNQDFNTQRHHKEILALRRRIINATLYACDEDERKADEFAIRLFKYFVCFILGMALMSLIALP